MAYYSERDANVKRKSLVGIRRPPRSPSELSTDLECLCGIFFVFELDVHVPDDVVTQIFAHIQLLETPKLGKFVVNLGSERRGSAATQAFGRHMKHASSLQHTPLRRNR